MQYIIPINIIELEEDNYHLMVNSVFQDKTEGAWVIDTGASKTVFDKSLSGYFTELDLENHGEIQSAGLGEETIDTVVGEIPALRINEFRVENLRVALIDLTHINKLYEKYTDIKIFGLIGSDFLYKYNAVINYQAKELILSVNNSQ